MQNSDFTLEELLAEKQRRQQAKSQPTSQQGQVDIQSLLKQAQPSGGQSIANAMSVLGGGKPLYGGEQSDLSKLYAQEAIKSQFEDPTVRQLREAEIKALSMEPPKGFVRQGKQLLADPDYVKPVEQAKLDEDARVRIAETDSLLNSAQDNLATIQKVKEGSKYFGPLGGLPTMADPQSLLGLNKKHYASRKEWENNVNKLLSQKVVDLISEMKRVSKTGATGFGQLSEKEGAILQQASTALSKDLPQEQALYYLNEMEKIHKKVLGGGNQGQVTTQVDNQLDSQVNAMLDQLGA